LGEIVQDGLALCTAQVEESWWEVEGQNGGGERCNQRGTGTETGLVGVTQRDGEVSEAARTATGARLAGVGVVGLVGEDADAGGCDEVIGSQGRYVGEGVGEGGLDEGVLGGGYGLLMAAVDEIRCGTVVWLGVENGGIARITHVRFDGGLSTYTLNCVTAIPPSPASALYPYSQMASRNCGLVTTIPLIVTPDFVLIGSTTVCMRASSPNTRPV